MTSSYPVLKLATSSFDYHVVDAELASCLQSQARLIKSLITKTTADLIEIGNRLLAVKDQLEHGHFIEWVEYEVGIVKRTAQSYMAIARLAESKSATIALLPPATVHRLAAKSAPVEVVDHVIERAASGIIVPDGDVVEMIKEAKSQRCEAKKKKRALYRRSKAARQKELLWRQELEEEERHRREKAEAIARGLIEEFGLVTLKRISDALNDHYVGEAIDKLAAPEPFAATPSEPFTETGATQCVQMTVP
jgi:hypothetical protein